MLALCLSPLIDGNAQEVEISPTRRIVQLRAYTSRALAPNNDYWLGISSNRVLFERRSVFEPGPAKQDELKFYQTRAFKITIAPATLMTLGLLTFPSRTDVRDFRDDYFPDFEDNFDDVAQALPELITFGLNIAGVKGQHSLGRAAASWFVGFSIANLLVTAGKRTLDLERPDGSSLSTFPSGHTMRAFVGAAFMSKEYGPRSVYYSIGGYSIATITGAIRLLNDKHWISDVLFGAGVGILSVELGYLLVEEVVGDRWTNELPPKGAADRPRGNPSFLDFKAGVARHVGDLEDRDDEFSAKGGINYGFEGAYFLNTNFGLGGELSIGNFPIDSDNFTPDPQIDSIAAAVTTSPMGMQSLFGGAFFNLPLSRKFSATGKLTGGWASGATSSVRITVVEDRQEELGVKELPITEFNPKDTVGWAAGIGLRGQLSRAIALGVYGEYNYSRPDVEIFRTQVNPDGSTQKELVETVEGLKFDYFAVGISIDAMLW